MKKSLRFVAVITLIAMLFSCTGCMLVANSEWAYKNRTYVQYETEDLDAVFEELLLLSEDEANAELLLEKHSNLNGIMGNLTNAVELSELEYYRDMTDEARESAYLNNMQLYNYFRNEKARVEKVLVVSPAKEKLVEALGESYVEQVLQEIVLTEEQMEILAQEDALRATYNQSMKSGEAEAARAVYPELVIVRKQIAEMYGHESYPAYAYGSYEREYTPQDVNELIGYAKKYITPVWEEMLAVFTGKCRSLAFSKKELLTEARKVVKDVGGRTLTKTYDYMYHYGLYDVDKSAAKLASAFMMPLSYYNDAFLFVSTEENLYDMVKFVHEFGHYHNEMVGVKTNSLDLLETHSQALELLAMKSYEELFSPEEVAALNEVTVYNKLWALLSNLMFESFEQYAFSLSDEELSSEGIVTVLEREFTRLSEEFGINTKPGIMGRQYEEVQHIYSSPFYCVSYATSVLSSVQFGWVDFGALTPEEAYLSFVTHPSPSYFEVLEDCGMESPFEEYAVRASAEYLSEQVKGLSASVTPAYEAAA